MLGPSAIWATAMSGTIAVVSAFRALFAGYFARPAFLPIALVAIAHLFAFVLLLTGLLRADWSHGTSSAPMSNPPALGRVSPSKSTVRVDAGSPMFTQGEPPEM